MRSNLGAWSLACAWRGLELPYALYGVVVVTGPRLGDGGVAPLEDLLAQQVHAVAQTVRETVEEWRRRPPASGDAAAQELLAYVRRDVLATG
ncbi:hypothetical protein AB0M39_40345 [Streptomyces sp. NPDC051907]|uniref:hypothetical protein n=1 Tax=Streptomyces sp. NPDC051907 TaxID=3155284 RepID=UPI00341F816D